jgi:hypothetical protein
MCLLFLIVIASLPLTKASPIPDLIFDEVSDHCLSRREEWTIYGYPELLPEDSSVEDFIPQPLPYELISLSQDLGLSNEGLDLDLGSFLYDSAALPLDTDPIVRPKGSCPAYRNPSPSGFEFNIIPNPFIPSCEAPEFTLCCTGIPVPWVGDSGDLGLDFLTLPYFGDTDGLVSVGECINCISSRHAFRYNDSSLLDSDTFLAEICRSQKTTFCCQYYLVGRFISVHLIHGYAEVCH